MVVWATLLAMARGEKKPECVLRDARIVNLLSGEMYTTNVALGGGIIVGIGPQYTTGQEIHHLHGSYLLPGFIDGHIHIESSLLIPSRFAEVVVPYGTTTVISDPHEIANVAGIPGIHYMLEDSAHLPLDVFLMASSCVPATHLETAGAQLDAEAIQTLLHQDRVLGLAELMNYPGAIQGQEEVLEKVRVTREMHKVIDGHAPGLTGKDLQAYLTLGIRSDHECTSLEEAREKLEMGMYIMIREGSAARNLQDLLPLVNPYTVRRCMLVTDDKDVDALLTEGHMDFNVRKVIALGASPHQAVQMATLNTAEYFGLRDRGLVAPGYLADLLVVEDLQHLHVDKVFKRGKLVAEKGRLLVDVSRETRESLQQTIHLPPCTVEMFRVPATQRKIRVIEAIPDQILTHSLILEGTEKHGMLVADPQKDLLKLAVIERHQASGNVGIGFVRGIGLQRGALASSIGHDSHNIIVAGVDDHDMLIAVEELRRIQGGFAVAVSGKVIASLPLPVAGLMSPQPATDVRQGLQAVQKAAKELGSPLPHPFATLSFLALPVIPALRLTDRGLVDVKQGTFVSLGIE